MMLIEFLKEPEANELYDIKMKDRFSREKSIEMFMIWHNHYHTNSDFEKIARCWNGGPRGMKKDKTIQYWIKVNKELNFPPPEMMVSDNIDDGSI